MKQPKDPHNEPCMRLKDALERLLQNDVRLQKTVQRGQAEEAWFVIMEKTLVPYTTRIKFRNGTLTVRISSAALREELTREKEKIKKRLNDYLGKNMIEKIIFK